MPGLQPSLLCGTRGWGLDKPLFGSTISHPTTAIAKAQTTMKTPTIIVTSCTGSPFQSDQRSTVVILIGRSKAVVRIGRCGHAGSRQRQTQNSQSNENEVLHGTLLWFPRVADSLHNIRSRASARPRMRRSRLASSTAFVRHPGCRPPTAVRRPTRLPSCRCQGRTPLCSEPGATPASRAWPGPQKFRLTNEKSGELVCLSPSPVLTRAKGRGRAGCLPGSRRCRERHVAGSCKLAIPVGLND